MDEQQQIEWFRSILMRRTSHDSAVDASVALLDAAKLAKSISDKQ